MSMRERDYLYLRIEESLTVPAYLVDDQSILSQMFNFMIFMSERHVLSPLHLLLSKNLPGLKMTECESHLSKTLP